MSYRMFDYTVPNVNFFGPNAISVVGERCKLLGGKKRCWLLIKVCGPLKTVL